MPRTLTDEEIKKAINNSIPIVIKASTLNHDSEVYIEKILEKFLNHLGFDDILNPLAYCLKELAVNANKANTKRVYFLDKGLNIGNPDDYQKGMEGFKSDTLSNIQYYFQKQKDHGLYLKVVFHASNKTFKIAVHNNVMITKKEQIRVFDRIARARAFESISEAFSVVLDNTEGAGLGIVILILMLKKIGLSEDAFELEVENEETIAKIVLPFSEIRVTQMDMLTDMVVREVDSLPRFPENLVYLQKLIADPESKIVDIARQVSTDPTLTAELLKQVNSPIYRVSQRVDNIEKAVKLVGMKGLRNLLYSYGTQKILGKKYSEMKSLWEHSNQAALYAFSLARNYVRNVKILEDVFVGAILHDLGKIIITSLHPDLLDKIRNFCQEKGISQNMLEDLSVGLNHAETGAMIAAKWNFPEQLITAIRCHHEPSLAPEEHREIAYIVYMADFISNLKYNKLNYDHMDHGVRRFFNINSEEEFEHFAQDIQQFVESDRI